MNIQLLTKTTVFIAGLIWVELFWLYALATLLVLFLFLCIIDTALWYYISRTRWTMNSWQWSDWLVSKVSWFVLLWLAIIIAWSMSFTLAYAPITAAMSIWVWAILLLRNWYEVVSLLENMNIIAWRNEQMLNNWLIKIINKAIWLTQNQIEKKVKRYD